MPFAVELFFDADLDQAVRQIWEAVAKTADVPNAMAISRNRPHVSLAVFESASTDKVLAALHMFAATQGPVELRLESVGAFPGTEGVVFAAPTPSRSLLLAHTKLLAVLGSLVRGMGPYYRLDRLFFHCTLNIGLSQEQVARVLAAALIAGLPLQGRASTVGLVRIPEMDFLGDFSLVGRDHEQS